MFVELIEQLRCPRDHAPTWLVASAERTEDRDILSGVLGCPECHAQYPIREGVADMRGWRALSGSEVPLRPEAMDDRTTFDPLRAAALLELTGGGGLALLVGRWCVAAHPIAEMIEGLHVLALNPAAPLASGGGVSVIIAPGAIPLRNASCRGAALDDASPDANDNALFARRATEVLRPRGRLLAPVALPLPPGVRELARDELQWIAERIPAPPVVQLGRR